MNNKIFMKKATACLLSVLMFASVLFIAPVHSFAVENSRPTAGTTQIAAGSTVMIKKGALRADTLEEISTFMTLFEFKVKSITNGVATIEYELDFSVIEDQFGFDAKTIVSLIGLDPDNDSAIITAINVAMAIGKVIKIPISRQVKTEDLILIKDGVKSTREELKYIGKEANINQGAIDVYGKEINKVWCILNYDITTVVDTTAHLQCRLTPGYVEKMGITKEAFGNMIGIDPSNVLYDTLYTALTNAGYTLNFDIDLQYLTVKGVSVTTDTESDSDTESDTDTDKKPVVTIKYGDPNGDKKVDLNDVVIIQKYLANLTTFTSKKRNAADVTGDGKVNLEDVTTIQKYIAKLIKVFPAEKVVG